MTSRTDPSAEMPATATGATSSTAQAGPSTSPSPSALSSWYTSHLDEHISSSFRHTLGQPSLSTFHKPSGQFLNLSTIVPPTNATWTPDEKARFFAALSRHSRYRPDLIARDVGSKSPDEVGWYIALLDSGTEKRRRDDGDDQKGIRDRRARWDGSYSWRPGLAPAAREVSDRWTMREEALAAELVASLRERDEEAEQAALVKKRKIERADTNAQLTLDPTLTPYEKRRILETEPLLGQLERRWQVEDWGRSLNAEKLGQLNALTQPEWAEWYGRRVRGASLSLTGNGDEGGKVKRERSTSASRSRTGSVAGSRSSESDAEGESELDQGPDEQGEQDEQDSKRGRRDKHVTSKADRNAKIAQDRHEYALLSAIPKKDRNPEQRKRLTVILNRKRNREEYRIKKLLEEGMTKEQIESEGGADVIYSKREEGGRGGGKGRKPGVAKKKNGQIKVEVAEDQGMAIGMGFQDELANAKLKQMGMYDYVVSNGLEVFNYNGLAKMLRQPLTNDISTSKTMSPSPFPNTSPSANSTHGPGPNLSFQLLRALHAELVFHLRHLIFKATILAEQAYLQLPGQDGKEPEMTAVHVRQALALEGGAHADADLQQDTGDEGDTEEEGVGEERKGEAEGEGSRTKGPGPAAARRERHTESFLPPNQLPWDFLPTLSIAQSQSQSRIDDLISEGAALSPSLDDPLRHAVEEGEGEGDALDSASPSTITDEEDATLDSALDRVDQEHDALYESALWSASASAEARGRVDADADGEGQGAQGDTKKKTKKGSEEDERNARILTDLGASWVTRSIQQMGQKGRQKKTALEKAYIGRLLSTGIQRRKRHMTQHRQAREPTTRLKKVARIRGYGKSEAFILESSSGSDDEEEEEEWEGDGRDSVDDDEEEEEDGSEEQHEDEDEEEYEKEEEEDGKYDEIDEEDAQGADSSKEDE